MSEETLVIVNPASANGKTGRRWPQFAAQLRSRIDGFKVVFTEYSGHGAVLVRDAVKDGARHIISVGGDGTHNEVVNGFFDGDQILSDGLMLSIIPTGTGGDLRRTLGLPNSAMEAIEFVGHAPKTVDVGKLEYTGSDGSVGLAYFLNISSFGASGQIVRLVNDSSKFLGGRMSFLIGVARGTLRYKNQGMRIVIEPGTEDETVISGHYYNGVVANAQYFGGGMRVAPEAAMDDGLFDIVLLGDLSKFQVMRGTPKLYSGTHLQMDDVDSFRGRVVRAEPTDGEEILIDLDGEQPGRLPATYSMIPACIKVCTGPGDD